MTEETQALVDRLRDADKLVAQGEVGMALKIASLRNVLQDAAAALTTLSRDLAAARACPDCQQPLACPAGTAERIAGLEAMYEETLTRAERAEADLAAARQERNEAQSNYDGACRTIALMHEAATGRSGEGPHLGVVEDVAAAVRAARAETWAAAALLAGQSATAIRHIRQAFVASPVMGELAVVRAEALEQFAKGLHERAAAREGQ